MMAQASGIYALGHLAYQTDGAGNKLATFTYDANGVPSSVVIGSGTSTPRYYYVYNGHGDVVALTDSVGTVVASYSYDAFGNLTSSSENLPNGWSNPYRYDGAEGVRYDVETGLYWLSVRAYDPTLGRFLSHDPLGRLAAQGLDFQPYVYASNNPVNKTDPSGMFSVRPILVDEGNGFADPGLALQQQMQSISSAKPTHPSKYKCNQRVGECWDASDTGSGGKGSQFTRPTTPAAPTQPAWNPNYSDAEHAALMTAFKFGGAGAGIGLTILGLNWLSGVLAASSIPEWMSGALAWLGIAQDVLAAQLTTLAWMLSVVEAETAILAGAFFAEYGANSEWWTVPHLKDFFGMVKGIIAGVVLVSGEALAILFNLVTA